MMYRLVKNITTAIIVIMFLNKVMMIDNFNQKIPILFKVNLMILDSLQMVVIL